MSGVWKFNSNGVYILNPGNEPVEGRRRVLVHLPTNEVITSHASLEQKLSALGWERFYNNPDLIQYHKRSSVDLISLPRDFANVRPFHLFDIVLKNSGVFEVRDM